MTELVSPFVICFIRARLKKRRIAILTEVTGTRFAASSRQQHRFIAVEFGAVVLDVSTLHSRNDSSFFLDLGINEAKMSPRYNESASRIAANKIFMYLYTRAIPPRCFIRLCRVCCVD